MNNATTWSRLGGREGDGPEGSCAPVVASALSKAVFAGGSTTVVPPVASLERTHFAFVKLPESLSATLFVPLPTVRTRNGWKWKWTWKWTYGVVVFDLGQVI